MISKVNKNVLLGTALNWYKLIRVQYKIKMGTLPSQKGKLNFSVFNMS